MADDPHDLDPLTLRVVRAIADEGSVTAAAESLGYSQSALSQHLRRAESRLSIALVERAGRTLRLTDAGRVLARHATAVSTALDAASGELAELRGLRTGRVRLAAFPSASPTIVPGLMQRLRERHPGLTLTYIEAEPPEAVEMVREDRVDLALTFSYPGDPEDPHRRSARGLTTRRIGSDDMLAVLPADHPQADRPAVDIGGLETEPWIAGCPRCRGHLEQVCRTAGFDPEIAFETDNFVAVEGLVAMGIGVALLPRLAIESFPVRAGVVVRPTMNADARTIHLVSAQGAARGAAVAATIRAIEEALAG